MSYENWMKENWDKIGKHSIWNIVLPGTHGSGVFSADNTIGVRNQSMDVGAQLHGGIRVFDIRVMYKPCTSDYVMHHSGIWANSQSFENALNQIKKFAASHPQEIIVLQIAPGYGSNFGDGSKAGAKRMIFSYLKDHLVYWERDNRFTLDYLRSLGKNIFLISGLGYESTYENIFWQNDNHILKDTWENYQSDWGNKINDKMNRLQGNVKEKFSERGVRFHYSSCMIGSASVHENAKNTVNPKVCDWIDEWSSNSNLLKRMNIFAVDFFETNDNRFMKTIIKTNRKLSDITNFAVASSFDNNDSIGSKNNSIITSNTCESSSQGIPNAIVHNIENAKDKIKLIGMDWDKLTIEVKETGHLNEATVTELESKGINRDALNDFVQWYADTLKS